MLTTKNTSKLCLDPTE